MRILILLLSVLVVSRGAYAQGAAAGGDATAQPRHAFTVLGEPALPADFKAFPYVNVNAPKGGEVNLATTGTFDRFHSHIYSPCCFVDGKP